MDAIFHRVSIRKFQDIAVEPDKITRILKAGMAAPSARNQQPWEFYVVTDKATIEKLSHFSPYAGYITAAPVVIVVAYRTELKSPRFALLDCSAAIQNIWLETDSLSLGGVWIGIAPVEERMKAVEEALNMPKTMHAFALFPLGYPAETRQQEDRWDPSRVHYV